MATSIAVLLNRHGDLIKNFQIMMCLDTVKRMIKTTDITNPEMRSLVALERKKKAIQKVSKIPSNTIRALWK